MKRERGSTATTFFSVSVTYFSRGNEILGKLDSLKLNKATKTMSDNLFCDENKIFYFYTNKEEKIYPLILVVEITVSRGKENKFLIMFLHNNV